jgi:hypothetical protein
MNTKLLGVIVGVILFAPFPACATIYEYSGPLYTYNTDPSLTGTHLTGTVTFNFDTSSYSGSINGGMITNMEFTSGTLTSSLFAGNQFALTDGVITGWLVGVCIVSCSSFLSTEGGSLSSYNPYGLDEAVVANTYVAVAGMTFPEGVPTNVVGSWTEEVAITPLPAALPLFATGLGALGLLGWRRKRKAAAAA